MLCVTVWARVRSGRRTEITWFGRGAGRIARAGCSSSAKMAAAVAGSSELLVHLYETTRRHIAENRHQNVITEGNTFVFRFHTINFIV